MAGVGRFEGVVIDVNDLEGGMTFWGAVLGVEFEPASTPQYRAGMFPGSGGSVVLQLVPETKSTVKNRMHLDIQVADRKVALAAVFAAGGERLRDHQDTGSNPVYGCADPDGNEFCLVI